MNPTSLIIIAALSGLIAGLMIGKARLSHEYVRGFWDGQVSGYKDGLRRRNGLKYEEDQ